MTHMTQREYLQSLNPNSPVPPQITVGDVLAIYELLDEKQADEYYPVDSAPRFCDCGEQLHGDEKICHQCADDILFLECAAQYCHRMNEFNLDGCGTDDDMRDVAIGR